MLATDTFRRQHNELLAVAGEISKLLDAEKLAQDAQAARLLIGDLSGKLKVHLAMEDKSLYPKLLEDSDRQVSDTAKRFVDEMGGIAKVFGEYLDHWPNSRAIQLAPGQFVKETNDLFGALASRIKRENSQLYPLLDRRG